MWRWRGILPAALILAKGMRDLTSEITFGRPSTPSLARQAVVPTPRVCHRFSASPQQTSATCQQGHHHGFWRY